MAEKPTHTVLKPFTAAEEELGVVHKGAPFTPTTASRAKALVKRGLIAEGYTPKTKEKGPTSTKPAPKGSNKVDPPPPPPPPPAD